jgi:hypothetical protein
MKKIGCIFILLCLVSASVMADAGTRVRTFFLESVRSGRVHGPFPFLSATVVHLETGAFRLDVLSATGSFILTEERSGAVFGVYELVPGRMIDAGYQLFTITRLSTTTLPPGQVPARPTSVPGPNARHSTHTISSVRPFSHSYQAGIVVDLINQVAYKWELEGEDGTSARFMERRGATLAFTRGVLTLTAGLLGDSAWDESINDPYGRFQETSLSGGTGWSAGMQILVPVFTDNRWSASIGGGIHYQRESYQLEYGTWETVPIQEPVFEPEFSSGLTNGVPDEPLLPPEERFVRQTTTATLSETVISLSARLDYVAPTWFMYAGLRALPWTDTDLQANIEIDDLRIPLTFERKDLLSGFAGAGFTYQDLHCFGEFEAGGVNAVRLGVTISF